ncbi:hypothetical protein BK140_30430 [Paenibacillus macerans]|nr:hypothetical protein BK140_30430 [Paenibacillus macerans]
MIFMLPARLKRENRGKKYHYSAAIPHLREIEELYAAIFSNRKEMPAIWTIHRKIRTKNSPIGDEQAWLRKIRTLNSAIFKRSKNGLGN